MIAVDVTVGRFTGLADVSDLAIPAQLARAWSKRLVQTYLADDGDERGFHARSFADVDLDVFLLTLCEA